VSGVTFIAADIVSPMLTATKVVVCFLPGVTAETGFRGRLCVHPLERNNLCDVAGAFDVRLPGAVT